MNIKELRRGMIVMVNTIEKLPGSAELTLAKRKIQEVQMWTGKLMEYTGSENPYAKHDGNRTIVKDIEPLFDATDDTLTEETFEKGNIAVIDEIREYLKKQSDVFVEYIDKGEHNDITLSDKNELYLGLSLMNIASRLIEARMWLGMELGRIRTEYIKNTEE